MNVLVVGNGNMGRNHARVLRELGHDVQTLDPSPAANADHYMLSFELIQWTETVCVATPIDLLAQSAEGWLKRGKDVLVEKPGATDLATLAYLHQLAVEQGVQLQVGYTERHNPVVQTLKKNRYQASIGVIQHVSFRRLGYASDAGRDPALDLAVHDLDVLDFVFGDEPVAIRVDHASRCGRHLSAILSSFNAAVPALSGCTVSIEASHLHPVKVRELEVVGTDGILQCDYQTQQLVKVRSDGRPFAFIVDRAEPLKREWEAFMRGEGSSGTAALALAEQMVEADAPVRIAA